MEAPPRALRGTQTINVRARKQNAGGGDTPTINSVDLYESGSFIREIIGSTGINSGGQTLTGTFEASEISDPAAVEIRIVTTGAGILLAARTVQIDSIEWVAELKRAKVFTGFSIS